MKEQRVLQVGGAERRQEEIDHLTKLLGATSIKLIREEGVATAKALRSILDEHQPTAVMMSKELMGTLLLDGGKVLHGLIGLRCFSPVWGRRHYGGVYAPDLLFFGFDELWFCSRNHDYPVAVIEG